MAEKKIYCGNGKQIKGQYGVFRSVSICLSDIPKEHITKWKNGKSYVKINISDLDQKNKYGDDVTATVDTWKADPNYKKNEGNENKDITNVPSEGDEDLPW
jgi:hypothetical protein